MLEKTCISCGNPSGRSKYCRECNEVVHRSSSLVSQNVKKLKNLLSKRRKDYQRAERFDLYYNNIMNNLKILFEYQVNSF